LTRFDQLPDDSVGVFVAHRRETRLYVYTTWFPCDDDGVYIYNSYIKYKLLVLLLYVL